LNSESVHLETEPADLSKEAFSAPFPKLDRLIGGMRALEQWYAQDFERRIAGLTELLRTQITEELQAQFSSEMVSQVERFRRQYEERLYVQSNQWESQRQGLEKEVQELRRSGKAVLEEISTTEVLLSKSAQKGNSELERQTTDAASLGKLVQMRIEELELKAYLRGLRFRLPTEG
jgi:flagellar biosynthesis chaperone FliJ